MKDCFQLVMQEQEQWSESLAARLMSILLRMIWEGLQQPMLLVVELPLKLSAKSYSGMQTFQLLSVISAR